LASNPKKGRFLAKKWSKMGWEGPFLGFFGLGPPKNSPFLAKNGQFLAKKGHFLAKNGYF